MADTPEAAAPATEATPTQTNNDSNQAPEQVQTPEIDAEQVAKYLGTNPETLGKFQKFVEANGQFDTAFEKIKSKISNPEKPTETVAEPQKTEPTSQQPQPVQQQKPQGRTNDDLMAEYYFEKLSKKPEYASIAEEIARGDVLTEMDKLGIQYKYADGSWNNDRIKDYLDLRAKTVPAKPTGSEPNASSAPTVTYTEVGDGGFTDINQAYKVLMEPGNPGVQKAEEYIRNHFNPNSENKK